jgi:hypothetical protein
VFRRGDKIKPHLNNRFCILEKRLVSISHDTFGFYSHTDEGREDRAAKLLEIAKFPSESGKVDFEP